MRKPSPKLLGAFVTAALLLLVGMVLFFGSASVFSRSTYFILFFDQSVNGLNEGSAVKFRGVPIGSVEQVMIRAENQIEGSTAIPVLIRIDRTRLKNDLGVVESAFEPEAIRETISRGLFAQLSLESFITGQLFVELSVDPKRSPGQQNHLVGESDLIEIPTLSSSLDEITADGAEIISKLSELDFGRLNENINRVLENLAVALGGLDTEAISRSVTDAADTVSGFIRSEDLVTTLRSTRRAIDTLSSTLSSYNLDEGPLAEALETWTGQLTATLSQINQLSAQLNAMTEPEGILRYELEGMLRELSRTARSVRELADYLEQNPNAILTGRPED